MKSDPKSFEPCPYTSHVAGPVKSIPGDAPYLPISVRKRMKKHDS